MPSVIHQATGRTIVSLLALAFGCCLFTEPAQAQVTWEVYNRFPLLAKEKFSALTKLVGTNPDGMELRLTQVDFRNQVGHLDGTSAWIEGEANYDSARLRSNSAQIVASSAMGTGPCNWRLATEDGQVAFSGTSACDRNERMSVELGKTYELRATRIDDNKTETAQVHARRTLVVAMGDSFTSGEGNPDYPAVFKKRFKESPPYDWATHPKYNPASIVIKSAQWLDQDCHRSLFSWPALYAMRRAISEKDLVVQFASFACSGAEVIDGFLLPQRNPPGKYGARPTDADTFAKESQQRQLARFLCGSQDLYSQDQPLDPMMAGYIAKYGKSTEKPKIWSCQSPAQVDEVLVQFGGNDTSFSGVVKYVFHPQELKYRGFIFLNSKVSSKVNSGLRESLKPVLPNEAVEQTKNLPALYALLSIGLKHLQIDSNTSSTRMVMYPDPVISDLPPKERESELMSCNLRTQDGNMPIQSLISHQLAEKNPLIKNDNAFAGASPRKLKEVRDTYIPALRDSQRSSAQEQGWKLIDSANAMKGFGFCAGSIECEKAGKDCPNGDRVRWAYPDIQGVNAPKSMPLAQLSDFKPYDLDRKRGMRYANDALLAGARLQGGRVALDWLFGTAHPTAPIHARIAAQLEAAPRTVLPEPRSATPTVVKTP